MNQLLHTNGKSSNMCTQSLLIEASTYILPDQCIFDQFCASYEKKNPNETVAVQADLILCKATAKIQFLDDVAKNKM